MRKGLQATRGLFKCKRRSACCASVSILPPPAAGEVAAIFFICRARFTNSDRYLSKLSRILSSSISVSIVMRSNSVRRILDMSMSIDLSGSMIPIYILYILYYTLHTFTFKSIKIMLKDIFRTNSSLIFLFKPMFKS